MESLPLTAIPTAIATDGQGARDVAPGEAGELSAFEQALEKEILLITPENAQTAVDAAALGLTLPVAETTAAAVGTQILEAILDSGSVLGSASVPAAAGRVDTADPRVAMHAEAPSEAALAANGVRQVGEAPRQSRAPADAAQLVAGPRATSVASGAAESALAADAGPSTVTENVRETRNAEPPLPSAALTQPRAALALTEDAAPANPLEAAASALAALRASTPAAAPTSAALEKTLNQAAEHQHATHASSSRSARSEASETPRLSEPAISLPLELELKRAHAEASAAAVAPERAAGADLVPKHDVNVTFDPLSSAALMPRWALAAHPASHAVAATATLRVDTPLGAQGWSDGFQQQIVWLVDRRLETAELHVNPPHLGPVDVMLKMSEDGARIAFCSPHAAVREAIEASLADLRAALAERGLSLGQALVSADPGTAREHVREENVETAARTANPLSVPAESEASAAPRRGRGLIDTFV